MLSSCAPQNAEQPSNVILLVVAGDAFAVLDIFETPKMFALKQKIVLNEEMDSFAIIF